MLTFFLLTWTDFYSKPVNLSVGEITGQEGGLGKPLWTKLHWHECLAQLFLLSHLFCGGKRSCEKSQRKAQSFTRPQSAVLLQPKLSTGFELVPEDGGMSKNVCLYLAFRILGKTPISLSLSLLKSWDKNTDEPVGMWHPSVAGTFSQEAGKQWRQAHGNQSCFLHCSFWHGWPWLEVTGRGCNATTENSKCNVK